MSDDTPMLAAPSAVRRVIEWTAIASSCLFSPSEVVIEADPKDAAFELDASRHSVC
jgi:hypothetical protein